MRTLSLLIVAFAFFHLTSYAQLTFVEHIITTDALGAVSVYAIDMDGDQDIDVLSASVDDNKIAWYENDGNQSFTMHTISTAAVYAFCVFAIDMDGDLDILQQNYPNLL